MNSGLPPDRDAIAALIPHSGTMCLLDEVLACDDKNIRCRASSHRDAANPLRDGGKLAALCGIEYGAQAMAVHGALMAGNGRIAGMLAAVREVAISVERLDDIAEDLIVNSSRLVGENSRLLYEFAISAGGREIMRGRAAVILRK